MVYCLQILLRRSWLNAKWRLCVLDLLPFTMFWCFRIEGNGSLHSGVFRAGGDQKYSRKIPPQVKFSRLDRVRRRILCISNFWTLPWGWLQSGESEFTPMILLWWWNLTWDSREKKNMLHREKTRKSPVLESVEFLFPAVPVIMGTQPPNCGIARFLKDNTSI